MTGDEDRQPVGGAGVRHLARVAGSADASGDVAIADGLAGPDLPKGAPDAPLEFGTPQVDGEVARPFRMLDQAGGFSNRIGHEDEPGTNGITFFGHSFIVDPFGRFLAEAGEKEEILIAKCDPGLLETVRRNWPFLRDRRVDAYGSILSRYIG